MDVELNERFIVAREKYLDGDRITDGELACLYGYYRRVYNTVSECNETCYKLVWKDALEKMNDFERIIEARKSRLTSVEPDTTVAQQVNAECGAG